MARVVGIVPARGGSKGIPGKNTVDFCGKPLIAWTIEQAKRAQGVESVWVTSDSDEILRISMDYGAKPIKRPDSLSGDTASSESAWLHAIDFIEEQTGKAAGKIDGVLALQCTSPLRESKDIEGALQLFYQQGYDSLFSASKLEDFLIWRKERSGELKSLNYDFKNRGRRQDRVEEEWVENGSFYLFKPELFRQFNNRLVGKIGIFDEMAIWKAFEIDSNEGLELCRILMQTYLIKKGV